MSSSARMKSQRARKANKRHLDDDEEADVQVEDHADEDYEEPGPSRQASQPARKKARLPARSQREPSQPIAHVQSDDLEDEQPERAGPSQPQARQQRAEPRQAPAPANGRQARPQIDQAQFNSLKTKVRKYYEESDRKFEEAALHGNINNTDMERLAGKVVRHMLFSHYEKPGHVVKRQALVDIICEDFKGDKIAKKLPQAVIPLAQYKMVSVFGIEMREVERVTEATKKKEDAAGAKQYVLHSALPQPLRNAHVTPALSGRGPHMALTMVVLGMIHLAGGAIDETKLYESLERLGVVRGEVHPEFGHVEEEIKKLEDGRYIMRSKKPQPVAGADAPEHVYSWAEVAEAEVGPEGIKKFLDEEFNKFQAKRQVGQGAQQQEEGEMEVFEIEDSD